jgi:hypothetical protein
MIRTPRVTFAGLRGNPNVVARVAVGRVDLFDAVSFVQIAAVGNLHWQG